jgi:hypothetical protein
MSWRLEFAGDRPASVKVTEGGAFGCAYRAALMEGWARMTPGVRGPDGVVPASTECRRVPGTGVVQVESIVAADTPTVAAYRHRGVGVSTGAVMAPRVGGSSRLDHTRTGVEKGLIGHG